MATRTDAEAGVQHRRCRVVVCRWPFQVAGVLVDAETGQPVETNEETEDHGQSKDEP